MNKLILTLTLTLTLAAPAVATHHLNLYETSTANCHPGAMHQTLNEAVIRGRAVITRVRCDSPMAANHGAAVHGDPFAVPAVAAPAPAPQVIHVVHHINHAPVESRRSECAGGWRRENLRFVNHCCSGCC